MGKGMWRVCALFAVCISQIAVAEVVTVTANDVLGVPERNGSGTMEDWGTWTNVDNALGAPDGQFASASAPESPYTFPQYGLGFAVPDTGFRQGTVNAITVTLTYRTTETNPFVFILTLEDDEGGYTEVNLADYGYGFGVGADTPLNSGDFPFNTDGDPATKTISMTIVPENATVPLDWVVGGDHAYSGRMTGSVWIMDLNNALGGGWNFELDAIEVTLDYTLDPRTGMSGVFHSLSDFSDVQGANNWYYLNYNESADTYSELFYDPMLGGVWLEDYSQPLSIRMDNFSPRRDEGTGVGYAPTLVWEAPASGTAYLQTAMPIVRESLAPAANGADVTVLLNDTVLWGPALLEGIDVEDRPTFDVAAAVNTGDRLYIRFGPQDPMGASEVVSAAFRVGFLETQTNGEFYVDFDDNYAPLQLISGTLFNSGAESTDISEGRAHFQYEHPGGATGPASGGGPYLQYVPLVPMEDDFIAQITIPDINQVTAMNDTASCGIICAPSGGASGDGSGPYSMAAGAITRLTAAEGLGLLDSWTTTQIGELWDYVLPGEPMTATTRAALRFVRTGNTLELHAAYGGDAPPEGSPEGGTFHLVNSQTINGAVSLYFYSHSIDTGHAVDIDDVYISGAQVQDYTSPDENPQAGLPLRIENNTNLASSWKIIRDPVWSHDGRKVAYFGAPEPGAWEALRVFDFETQETKTLFHDQGGSFSYYGTAWSPDDSEIYFTTYGDAWAEGWANLARCSAELIDQSPSQVDFEFLSAQELVPDARDGLVRAPNVISVDGDAKLLVSTHTFQEGPPSYLYDVIWYMDLIDATGDVDVSSARPIVETTQLGDLTAFALSPDGDHMLVCIRGLPTESDLYLLSDIQAILAGGDPIEDLEDERVHPVDVNAGYVIAPGFSQDGTHIVYSKDITMRYRDWPGNLHETDFDIHVDTLQSALGGGNTLRIPQWGNQMGMKASGGGTRVLWVDAFNKESTTSLYVSTLRIINDLELANGVVENTFALPDASGSLLTIAADTTVTGVDPGATGLDISVFTPYSPIEEVALGMDQVPVVRDFAPSGISFNPPAQVQMAYTDQEIRELDEENMAVLWVHDGEPQMLDIIEVNAEENYIVVEVPGFSEYGIADNGDSDGDGLGDLEETVDLDPLTPGVQNPFDPNDPDSTGDGENVGSDGILDGENDWDGDGVSNAQEFSDGTGPLDPLDAVQMPVLNWVGLVIVAILLGLHLASPVRRKRR